MISLPTVQQEYERELENNSTKLQELFSTLFPLSTINAKDIIELYNVVDNTHYPADFLKRIMTSVEEVTNNPLGGQVVIDINPNSVLLHSKKKVMLLKSFPDSV